MKKLIPLLIVALLASAVCALAVVDPEADRQIARLKTRATALEADVSTAQTDIDAVEVVAAAAVPKASLAVIDTNDTVTVTTHTPAFAGQILIGSVADLVWIAGGTTTNDWIAIVEAQ